jgi:outer membrane protein assembly factor BamB
MTLYFTVMGAELKEIQPSVRQEAIQTKNIQSNINILAKIVINSSSILEPVFSNKRIFAAEKSGVISCFDTLGKQIWKNDSLGELVSIPVVVDNYLISGTTNGDINEVKSNSGELVQSVGIDDPVTTGINFTDYIWNNELAVPKTSNSKAAIVFGTASGKIYCYDAESLQEYWNNSDAHKRIRFNPVITGNKILFSCMDGYIYCIESDNGLLIWRWKESAETGFYNASILTDGKYIYAVSSDKNLYCIDLLLGKLVWKSKGNNIFPSIAFSKDLKNIITETENKKIVFFSAEKGKIAKEINLTSEFDSTSIPVIDMENGLLYCSQGNIFILSNNSNQESIFNFGDSIIISMIRIDEKKFMAASSKGTIIIFGVR